MRSSIFAAAIGVATLVTITLCESGRIQAQQQAFPKLRALAPSSRDALDDRLQRDCSVGPTANATAGWLAIPGVDEAVLIEAFQQGPSPELERTFTTAFEQAYVERNATLAREGVELLGAEDAARLLGVSRDDYVKRRMEDARLNYRTNTVHGLGAIGTAAALALLAPIAADPADPVRSAAQAAIETIRERVKSKN